MTADLHDLTIAGAAEEIASKRLSPVDLTHALLRRIEDLEPKLNAFITVTADLALDQARTAESEITAGNYRGPMHGIPFGLKDIYNTAGVLTSAHSKILMDHVPGEDATTVAKLKHAGAVLLGKHSSHEFAHGGPSFDLPWPPARNPWNLEHFTGGSSSGSAAAVAAGLSLGALGSDTGGSIRMPAALCGIAGLKPTYGLVSRYGVIPNSFTFDTCGPMAWTVEDCAIMLQATVGHDPRDSSSVARPIPDYRAALRGGVGGMRIGVIRHFWEEDLPANDEVATAMEAALEVLSRSGARLEDIRVRPMQDYYDIKIAIAESELYATHEKDLRQRSGDFGTDFLARCLPACLFHALDYVQAQRERRRILAEMKPLYDSFDVLVTAGPYGPAPRIDAHRSIRFWQRPSITTPFNVTGGPALALCIGFSDSGLPLSMQVIGRPFDEATVLRVGHAYETATGWRDRRPQLDDKTEPAAVPAPQSTPEPPDLDLDVRAIVDTVASRAGLRLTADQRALLDEAAPYVLAMGHRLRRDFPWKSAAANVFRLPRSGTAAGQ